MLPEQVRAPMGTPVPADAPPDTPRVAAPVPPGPLAGNFGVFPACGSSSRYESTREQGGGGTSGHPEGRDKGWARATRPLPLCHTGDRARPSRGPGNPPVSPAPG